MRIRWQDWANLGLGVWLGTSPYVMGYTLDRPATGNACGLGIGIVVFNLIIACRLEDKGEEILNILLGLWLVLSPFSLGFSGETGVATNAMAVGTALVVLAVWQIIATVSRNR
ncbi:MAG: SPW repeat protein [Rudaea sp.]|nr:SPW repeat protein [Rudaea sp.]